MRYPNWMRKIKAIADDLDVDYIHLESTDNISYPIEAIKAGSTVSMGKSRCSFL